MQDVPYHAVPGGFRPASAREAFGALTDKYLREASADRRGDTRHPVWTNILLWLGDSDEPECVSTDISANGVRLFCKRYIQPGTNVRIGFASLDERLVVEGVVRHSV
ncbi:MAG: hypothetical protein O7H40_17970 [Gammaproteobacteria bacterium]|nr:hypothetical protein [Gammaproteobacteria bacterium]